MYTKTAILVTAVFMLVTASASFAQDPISDDETIKPYPVCSTWRAKDAGTGTCRTAFMDARNALGYTCKQGKILPPENEGHEKIATYVAACGCERKMDVSNKFSRRWCIHSLTRNSDVITVNMGENTC